MNNDEEKDPNLWFLNKNVISKGKTFGIPNRNIFEAVFFTSLTEYCIVSINFTKVAFVSCTVIICPIVFGLFLRGLKNRSVLQILFSSIKFHFNRRELHLRSPESPKFVCIKKAYDNTAEKTENIINESIEKAKSSVEEIMFQKFPDINDNETWKKIPKVEEEDTVNITSYDDDLQNELDEYENPEMEGFQDFMLSMNSTTPESDSSDFMTSLNDIPEPDMEIIVPEFLEKESND